MIISEVLDAIDNINNITLESEINICQNILESYNKLDMILESNCDTDISTYSIYQEGKNFDKFKDEFKKQNEGKSTINKIIFAIPRIIKSLIRLIISKFKKNSEKIDSIDMPLKTEKSNKAGKALIGLLASGLSLYGTAKYLHIVFKEADSMKYGNTSLTQFLAMLAKDDFPSVFKLSKKAKDKIEWKKLQHIYKKSTKLPTEEQLTSQEHLDLVKMFTESKCNIIMREVFEYGENENKIVLGNIWYCNELYKVITDNSTEPVTRSACITEFKTRNDDLIKICEIAIDSVKKHAENDIKETKTEEVETVIRDTSDSCIAGLTKSLDKFKERRTKVLEIEKQIGPTANNELDKLKKANEEYSKNFDELKSLCKKYSKSKLAYDFSTDIYKDTYCIQYNVMDVVSILIKKLENISAEIKTINSNKAFSDNKLSKISNKPDHTLDESMNSAKNRIMKLLNEDVIKIGDKNTMTPIKDIKSSIDSNTKGYSDAIDKFTNELKGISFIISDDEQNRLLTYVNDHAQFIRLWCDCYQCLIQRITCMNALVTIKSIRDLYKE